MIEFSVKDGYFYNRGKRVGRAVGLIVLWLDRVPKGCRGLAVPSLTDHRRNMKYLASRVPRNLRARAWFALDVQRYAKAVGRKYPLPFTVEEAMAAVDRVTLRRWVAGKGPSLFYRGWYVRRRGNIVETSQGLKYPVREVRALLTKIDAGQCEGLFHDWEWMLIGDTLSVGCNKFSLEQVRRALKLSRPRRAK